MHQSCQHCVLPLQSLQLLSVRAFESGLGTHQHNSSRAFTLLLPPACTPPHWSLHTSVSLQARCTPSCVHTSLFCMHTILLVSTPRYSPHFFLLPPVYTPDWSLHTSVSLQAQCTPSCACLTILPNSTLHTFVSPQAQCTPSMKERKTLILILFRK